METISEAKTRLASQFAAFGVEVYTDEQGALALNTCAGAVTLLDDGAVLFRNMLIMYDYRDHQPQEIYTVVDTRLDIPTLCRSLPVQYPYPAYPDPSLS